MSSLGGCLWEVVVYLRSGFSCSQLDKLHGNCNALFMANFSLGATFHWDTADYARQVVTCGRLKTIENIVKWKGGCL